MKAIKAQVCDVSQPLLGVKKVVAAGNRVVFEDGGVIHPERQGWQQNMADGGTGDVHIQNVG